MKKKNMLLKVSKGVSNITLLSLLFLNPISAFADELAPALIPELSRIANTVETPLATTDITGSFTNIRTEATNTKFYGGAIYNYGKGTPEITRITGTFQGNSNYTTDGNDTRGGAIYNSNYAKIGIINADFIENSSVTTASNYSTSGGAIYNSNSAHIQEINGNFINNFVKAAGSKDVSGGAITNSTASIGAIKGDFIGNSVTSTGGGKGYGGAIYNYASELTLIDSSFIDNSVVTESTFRKGGAIYMKGSNPVNIIADTKDVIFSGNFTATKDNGDGTFENKESNAITMAALSNLNLNAGENKIIFNDKINSDSNKANININSSTAVAGAPTTGTVIIFCARKF